MAVERRIRITYFASDDESGAPTALVDVPIRQSFRVENQFDALYRQTKHVVRVSLTTFRHTIDILQLFLRTHR